MKLIKLKKGSRPIGSFNNIAFFKLSIDNGESDKEDLPATTSLVYTLSSDGSYYIVGTGFTSIEAIDNDRSGGTAGSGLDSTWSGGQLVIPFTYNGKPVKAIAPRAFATVKNITEAYIRDGITCIGHRAFQCTEAQGFDTTMTVISLPNTLLSMGGYADLNKTTAGSGSGRVLWGRQGLVDIEVNFGKVTKGMSFQSQFAYIKANTVTINSKAEVPKDTWYQYIFQNSEIDKVVFGKNFKNMYTENPNLESSKAGMFYNAKINEVHFTEATSFGFYIDGNVYYTATINRMYFPKIEEIKGFSTKPFAGLSKCKIYIETPPPTITSAALISDAFSSSNKIYFNYKYLENYYTATNWTTFFPTFGAQTDNIRVYGDFESGETIPHKIGTAPNDLFEISWFKSDDMPGMPIDDEIAKETARYYGKLYRVVE